MKLRTVCAALCAALLSQNLFAAWTMAGDKKSMAHESGWALTCSVSDGKVTISGIKTNPASTPAELDLACGFTEGEYVITAIGTGAFDTKSTLASVKLPNTLTTIGDTAFYNCSNLTTVEPFLPASVTSIGINIFRKCSKLEGKLELGTGGTCTINATGQNGYEFAETKIQEVVLGDGVTRIPFGCFNTCKALTNVTFGTGLSSIDGQAFYGCAELARVEPFLPDSLASIGASAFKSCSKLKGKLTLGMTTSLTLGTEVFQSAGIEELVIGDHVATLANQCFMQCSSLTKVTLGANITGVGANEFNSSKNIKEILFMGDLPTFGANAFYSWGKYQSRWLIPSKKPGWAAYLADSTKFTAKENISASELKNYPYSDGNELLGCTKTIAPLAQWVAAYDLGTEVISLSVAGSRGGNSAEYGTPSPAYGLIDDATGDLPLTCTVSEYAVSGNCRYQCVGYKLEDLDPLDPAAAIEGDTLSYVFNPTKVSSYRLSWLWTGPIAYRPVIDVAKGGSVVTNNLPDAEGFFAAGATMSFTAQPAAGYTFVRWMGDVPADQQRHATITLEADGDKTLKPYFSTDWTFNGNNLITDGDWDLLVSSAGDGKFNIIQCNRSSTILDLRKAIRDSNQKTYQIVAINNSIFSNRPGIEEVYQAYPDFLGV